ncbi:MULTISPECIES: hypothetical protein [Actinomycetes]|uniref:hypothetical protein n=1 Tax=Actinomycetes TaxID=1760 RepID=UPI0033D87D06
MPDQPTDRYPLRVRLHGGRNTHAARPAGDGDQITACDYFLPAGTLSHQMPPTAVITCRTCHRRTIEETR